MTRPLLDVDLTRLGKMIAELERAGSHELLLKHLQSARDYLPGARSPAVARSALWHMSTAAMASW